MASSLARTAAAVAAAVGVPGGCIAVFPVLREQPLLTVALTLAYETCVLLFGFGAAVFSQLRTMWAARIAEAFDGAVQRLFSRYTRYYLRYVMAETRYVDVKGVTTKADFALEMKDVYVRLALDSDSRQQHRANIVDLPTRHRRGGLTADIWEWLRLGRKDPGSVVSVIGPPGRGKTTLLKHVAFVVAKGGRAAAKVAAPHKIPVFIHLRDHKDWTFSANEDLVGLVDRAIPSFGGRKRPPLWIENNLRRGRFLLLLDGLDEIPDTSTRRAVTAWLERQSGAQTGNRLIVTSRPFGYRDAEITGAMVVTVQAFTTRQIEAFVGQWYLATSIREHGADNQSARLAASRGAAELLDRLLQKKALYELSSNPLLLTMIATVHHYRDALPGSRAELYREMCDVFLGKRHEARGIALDMPASRKKTVLQALAFAMMESGARDIAACDAAKVITPALARVSTSITPADFLRTVEESSGVLLERERELLTFAHPTVQEFLAAEHIRESGLGRRLIGHIEQSWWHETALLYAANSDATDIVTACLRADGEHAAELLALAVQCVDEARELAAETRELVRLRLDPPDARANPASRRDAARARLLLRATREVRLSNGVYAGPPVTWLEYQYFLDSIEECRVPDHWHESVFPEGAENSAVAGIRHSDAEVFCAWLSTELNPEHGFRLPHRVEVREMTNRTPETLSFWCADSYMRHDETDSSRLFKNSDEGLEPVPQPDNDHHAGDEALLGIVQSDFGASGSPNVEPGEPFGSTDATEAGRTAGYLAAHIDLKIVSSDLDRVERDVRDAEITAEHYASLTTPSDSATDAVNALVDNLMGLRELVVGLVRRESYAARATSEVGRQYLRRQAVTLAAQASDIRHSLGGKDLTGYTTRRLDSAQPDDRLVIGQISMSLVERQLLRMYSRLLLHEAILRELVPPQVQLRYARPGVLDPALSPIHDLLPDLAEKTAQSRWQYLKPVFDRVAAMALIVLLAPLLLAISAFIVASSGWPIFFTQRRSARSGEFTMVKFRTMVVGADKLAARATMAMETESIAAGPLFKLRRDPRVTRAGLFLRRYSLDELPQLFNVLLGTMSLVGPRPPLPKEVAKNDGRIAHRLLVKPGITGLWQVSGRSDLTWAESLRLDLRYAEDGTFRLDMMILLKTFRAVLIGRGAY